METLTSLSELYLSHNGISAIQNLPSNGQLTVLDLSANRLTRVDGLSSCTLLEDLWVRRLVLAHTGGGVASAH